MTSPIPRRRRDPQRRMPAHQHLPAHHESTYAFVDAQNIHRSVREQGWNLDWSLLRGVLRERFGVNRALLFIGFVPGNEPLYAMLRTAGFELVFTQAITARRDGKMVTKGNVDTDLVLRAMIDRDRYAHAVIVSGDGDMHPLAAHLQSEGKLSGVLIPAQRKASRLLRGLGDTTVAMDTLRPRLERRTTARPRASAAAPRHAPARRGRSASAARGGARARRIP